MAHADFAFFIEIQGKQGLVQNTDTNYNDPLWLQTEK